MDELKNLSVEELEKALDVAKQKVKSIPFVDIKSSGSIKSTIPNFEMLLKHNGINIRYNEMSKDMEISLPYIGNSDIEMNSKIAMIHSLAHEQGFPITEIDGYILEVGSRNSYHPVREWLDKQVWDGKNRLDDYYNSIVLDEVNPMKETMMRKWAISLVGALYHPYFSCEGVLTFSGEQGQGKTIWVENLLPKEYRNVWNKDAVVIDTRNKDSLIKALKYWIAELGELDATFKRSDIEALKGFITEKVDEIRSPYERKANRYKRKTVFYATVNDEEFLRDTQNRRFWVLGVKKFNHGLVDPGQFWAQIKSMYMSVRDKIGSAEDREQYNEYGWFMSPDERKQMEPLQERYKSIDPIEELMAKFLELPDEGTEFLSCTEILQQCSYGTPNRSATNIASKWLKKKGYERRTDDKKWRVKIKSLVDEKVVSFDRFKKKTNGLF